MLHCFAATDRLWLLAGVAGLSLGCAGEAEGVPAAISSEVVGGQPSRSPRDAARPAAADGRYAGDAPESPAPLAGGSACGAPLEGMLPGNSVVANHRVLWRLPTPETALVQGLVVDAALYLRDNRANIWRLAEGETAATRLYSPQGLLSELSGALVSDGQYLYWGEAVERDGERAAPSRVVRMLETGGPVSVLVESDVQVLGAFGAVGDQLLVSVESPSFQGLALVDEQGGELRQLAPSLPLYLSHQDGDAVYFSDGPSVGSAPANLMRAELPAFEPQVVVQGMRGPVFDVGPGYVLTRQGSVEDERLALLGQNFVLFDRASGCTQVLPSNGDTISFRTAQDATHVYWLRHVPGYSFSPDHPPPPPEAPLYRTDIRSGVIERVETPGFIPTFSSGIIASDSRHVYLDTPVGVVAIDKPN